jgi:Uma2 family endonuclease
MMPPPARWDDAPTPVLVVEVISDSTRRSDEVKKRRFYMESGVPEYWIVDAGARTCRVITAMSDRLESTTLRWQPPGASLPLEVDVGDFFRNAIG